MASSLTFTAIKARQTECRTVFTFAATADQVLRMARIDRIGRDVDGDLFGFQRPQIASHIHEIRDYLQREDAVLPNAVVVAFTKGVTVRERGGNIIEVEIDVMSGPPGLVVDGQQRLTALAPLDGRPFEIFVSGLLCENEEELRRQFILINNTRPLPKELIYELLPTVDALPKRMSSRAEASALMQRLNFDPQSTLCGQIHMHTNPTGVISGTAIQRVIMNSRSNGALRILRQSPDGDDACFRLVSAFYGAVQEVFARSWQGMTPKTSRLVHSVGVTALGYVMEMAVARYQARNTEDFKTALERLKPHVAWTERDGMWNFRSGPRKWNELQNLNRDIRLLADHLMRGLRLEAVDGGSVDSDEPENSSATAVAG